jgi:hypothetical protein
MKPYSWRSPDDAYAVFWIDIANLSATRTAMNVAALIKIILRLLVSTMYSSRYMGMMMIASGREKNANALMGPHQGMLYVERNNNRQATKSIVWSIVTVAKMKCGIDNVTIMTASFVQ